VLFEETEQAQAGGVGEGAHPAEQGFGFSGEVNHPSIRMECYTNPVGCQGRANRAGWRGISVVMGSAALKL